MSPKLLTAINTELPQRTALRIAGNDARLVLVARWHDLFRLPTTTAVCSASSTT
jgi:hypothetical protein